MRELGIRAKMAAVSVVAGSIGVRTASGSSDNSVTVSAKCWSCLAAVMRQRLIVARGCPVTSTFNGEEIEVISSSLASSHILNKVLVCLN